LLPQTSKILADNAKMFEKYLGAYIVFQNSILEFELLCTYLVKEQQIKTAMQCSLCTGQLQI
jgi:hypothetical protein